MVAMGSIDMFGNPVGFVRRVGAAAERIGEHAVEGVKTRDVAAFGKSAGLEVKPFTPEISESHPRTPFLLNISIHTQHDHSHPIMPFTP